MPWFSGTGVMADAKIALRFARALDVGVDELGCEEVEEKRRETEPGSPPAVGVD